MHGVDDGDGRVRLWVVAAGDWNIADTVVPTAAGVCAIASGAEGTRTAVEPPTGT